MYTGIDRNIRVYRNAKDHIGILYIMNIQEDVGI